MKKYQARLYLTIKKKVEVKAENPKVALAALRSIAEHIALHFGQFLLSKCGWSVEQEETEISPMFADNKEWNADAFKIFED